VEDEKTRAFVNRRYRSAGIAKIEIERRRDTSTPKGELITIYLHVGSPGMLIGKHGAGATQLTKELEDLLGTRVLLKVIEVSRIEMNAQLVALTIADQLEKRGSYRRAMRRAAETAMTAGALGFKVQLTGRIAGAEIARSEGLNIGRVPLHTLRAEIDYGLAEAFTKKGTIGIKVWIFKGERLAEKEKHHAVDAAKSQVPQSTEGQNKGESDPVQ
jgi:small subunit ribosomal protein S3